MAEHRIVVPGVVGSTPIIHPIFCADKHKPPQRYRKVDAVFSFMAGKTGESKLCSQPANGTKTIYGVGKYSDDVPDNLVIRWIERI